MHTPLKDGKLPKQGDQRYWNMVIVGMTINIKTTKGEIGEE
jgi:hypothetical protein